MPRKFAYPSGHWSLKVEIPYSMGVRAGDMIILAGQVDMKGNGEVQHPNDLYAQTEVSVGHIKRILGELGADCEDIVKLVVFYKTDGSVDEDAYRAEIAKQVGIVDSPIAIGFVPLSHLAYPGMMVEIDTYAMRRKDGNRITKVAAALPDFEDLGRPFVPAVRAGQMIFTSGIKARARNGAVLHPNDTVEQARVVQNNLLRVLKAFGADQTDVVKLNTWYVAGGTVEEWEKSARLRKEFFPEPGPSATGISLATVAPRGARFQMDAWAMLGEDGKKLPKKKVWLKNHWDWPKLHLPFQHGLQCGNMVFVAGQAPLNDKGEVLEPNDMPKQSKMCMDYVGRVLAHYGLNFKDVVKMNAYYKGKDGPDELHGNVNVRSSYFKKPGPASTGVPVPHLAYDGMTVEFEAIAMTE